jgi:predicted esterase
MHPPYLVTATLFLIATACGSRPLPPSSRAAPPALAPPVADDAPTSVLVAPAPDAPLEQVYAPFVTIPVPGYEDATLSLPGGPSDERRPVVVALHGLRGRADWTCHVARELFDTRAFVLCPAGTPLPPRTQTDHERPRYTLPEPHRLGLEIAAGLAALEARYGTSVDAESPVLYGHSLGAIFGATLALAHPAMWQRVVLSEGGYSAWASPGAREFVKLGGRRVLFACGTRTCEDGAKAAAGTLKAAGAEADVGYAAGAGHRSWGPIVDVMQARIDWLLAGDARFGGAS